MSGSISFRDLQNENNGVIKMEKLTSKELKLINSVVYMAIFNHEEKIREFTEILEQPEPPIADYHKEYKELLDARIESVKELKDLEKKLTNIIFGD